YRIAAIKVIMEGAAGYGFNARPDQSLYNPIEFDEVSLSFKEPKTWAALAKEHQCDYKTLRLLNPHLSARNALSGGPWTVRLPKSRTKTLGT
ncbi:MAG: hypothetical protein LBE49_00755, partial [Deltaproteobacteria bacterium]|nr:hypothetical protein [Deltaproteobacteria bacterium]